jgi:integrase
VRALVRSRPAGFAAFAETEDELTGAPEYLSPEASGDPDSRADVYVRAGSSDLALSGLRPDDSLYADAQRLAQSIAASKSEATKRAYRSDWKDFEAWCGLHGLAALPASAQTVALYISHLSEPAKGEKARAVATITRRLAAINSVHKGKGFKAPGKMDDPVLAAAFQGIRRILGVKQKAKKPLTLDLIVRIVDNLQGPVASRRDHALIVIGFVGALRRSEIAAMRVEDLKPHREGYTLRIPVSKTDQERKGREVELLRGRDYKTCPVRTLQNWLRAENIVTGPVFRKVDLYGNVGEHPLTGHAVGEIVKRLVRQAELADPKEYAAHSLRAGFVTQAAAKGASDRQIMRQTGHKSHAMIDRYARTEQRDREAAVSALGN